MVDFESIEDIIDYLRGSQAVQSWSNRNANIRAIDFWAEHTGNRKKYGCGSCIRQATIWIINEYDKQNG